MHPRFLRFFSSFSKMGCKVSRLGSHGRAFSTKLRPLLHRLEEIKDYTPTKKLLLPRFLHKNAYHKLLFSPKPSKKSAYSPEVSPKGKGGVIGSECCNDLKEHLIVKGCKTEDERFMDAYEDLEVDGNDDDGRERMIGYENALPSSPSFRIYFMDALDDPVVDNDGLKEPEVSRDGATPSKEYSSVEKKVKRSKMKNFRKVLPKNLFAKPW